VKRLSCPSRSELKSGSLPIHSDGRSISQSGLPTANYRLRITFPAASSVSVPSAFALAAMAA
jgi:hypothetical protein